MKTKTRHLRDKLLASYWFFPALMSLAASTLALLALARDHATRGDESPPRWRAWLEVNTAEGARELLGTIASSTIALAGVIFSITVLALSFASAHYGPRLLRNFMRDRRSQLTLGAFVATYLYCLLVLRTIGEGNEHGVPHLAVALALLLALASMGVLIFFVHHIAYSLQVSTIIHAVGADLDALIDEHAQRPAAASVAAPPPDHFGPVIATVEGAGHGYVEALSCEELIEVATEHDAIVEMHVETGDHVGAGLPLASLRGAKHPPSEKALARLHAAVVAGAERTNEQDLAFPVDQLAEIAVRALSPGVNDPFTAIQCINRLGCGVALLAREPWPDPVLRDAESRPRLYLVPGSFERLVHRAYDQILHFGADNPVIPRQVMKMLAFAVSRATAEARPVLASYADHVLAVAEQRGPTHATAELRDLHRQSTAR